MMEKGRVGEDHREINSPVTFWGFLLRHFGQVPASLTFLATRRQLLKASVKKGDVPPCPGKEKEQRAPKSHGDRLPARQCGADTVCDLHFQGIRCLAISVINIRSRGGLVFKAHRLLYPRK